jgi:hypothetical protein
MPTQVSGIGTLVLAEPGSLQIVIDDMPEYAGMGEANPPNYYGLGQLRLGTAQGYLPPFPLTTETQLVPCPNGATILGYALHAGVTITVTERPEQPYAGPTGPPGEGGGSGSIFDNINTVTLNTPNGALDPSFIFDFGRSNVVYFEVTLTAVNPDGETFGIDQNNLAVAINWVTQLYGGIETATSAWMDPPGGLITSTPNYMHAVGDTVLIFAHVPKAIKLGLAIVDEWTGVEYAGANSPSATVSIQYEWF